MFARGLPPHVPMAGNAVAGEDFDTHVINQVGNVLLDKSGATPLDLEITEEMLNARIARFPGRHGARRQAGAAGAGGLADRL